jgi:hypothetical protein
MEIFGIVLTVIGLIWGFYTYYNRKSPQFLEEREHAVSQFDSLKRLNNSVLKDLFDFAEKYNVYDEEIQPGVTFRYGIEKTQEVRDKLLTDENYEVLKNTNSSLINIQSITENIKIQIKHHCEVQTMMELISKHVENQK